MALSEEEIVRYSRQILLREVGGVGQQRLLASEVPVRGEGAAAGAAVAYLAASGVRVSHGLDAQLSAGFPVPPSAHPVEAHHPPVVWLGAEVALCGNASHDGALIVCAPSGTCAECVSEALKDAVAIPERVADLAGALGALMEQRLTLGMGEGGAQQIRVTLEGQITVGPLPGCARCR